MSYPAPPTIHLRAKRETIALVASVTATTFALSYAVHAHRPAARHIEAAAPRQAWTGTLADMAALGTAPSHMAPITSASLVVSKSELALPLPAVRPLVRLHGCDGTVCTSRTATAPTPPRRQAVAPPATDAAVAGTLAPPSVRRTAPHGEKPSLLARLNPLNHLPDTRTLKTPFSVASDTVSGWFKRF